MYFPGEWAHSGPTDWLTNKGKVGVGSGRAMEVGKKRKVKEKSISIGQEVSPCLCGVKRLSTLPAGDKLKWIHLL